MFKTVMNSSVPETISPSLLARVRQNESPAWERLVHLFGPLVRTWARQGGVRDADLDDVVQETFAKVTRSLPGFRRDRPGDTFLGWLRTLTRHRVADYHAKAGPAAAGGTDARQALEQFPEPLSESAAPDDPASVVQRALDLLRGEFEPHTWDAFLATARDGRRADDVAAELGLSPGAVYVAKSRVLKRLREELDGLVALP